jgi:hypothetical protein
VFLLNILTGRITLPPATRAPSFIHTALLRLHHKARPGKRRINLKPVQFVGFETGDCSTLKVPKELGRTYLVVLPLCVFSHGSYDGLAISISFKPRRMPNM